MPIELVTGPANAEKAGAVLRRARELAGTGEDPILVVPTAPDVLAYRRELAAGGLVFGVGVLTFERLEEQLAARAGTGGRGAPGIVRRRVAQAAAAATPLRELASSAATPGFAGALAELCGELAGERIGPGLWYTAMREWGKAEPARAAYAEELAALYGAYRDRIAAVGGEPAAEAYAAHDALLLAPARWGATPVLFYGFDDFTPPELDAIRTLERVGVTVVVSLPYEPGREELYRTRARTLSALLELAGDAHAELPPGPEPQPALAHVERSLLTLAPRQVAAAGAVELLVGGGERAELELIAETVRGAIAGGTAPEEIAVALRDSRHAAPLVARVFDEAGIPIALERSIPLSHTTLGRGLLSLLAAALPGGTAEDLLTWLRVPGVLDRPALADTLEAELRRGTVRDAAGAHDAWERIAGFRFGELDRLSSLAERPAALCERLAAQAEELLTRRWRGQGALLPAASLQDAQALRRLRSALAALAAMARDEPALAPDANALAALLGAETVTVGRPPGPGLVTVASPLRLRARRVRMLVLGRMQEGSFPRPAAGDPFLGDAERRAINAAGGLRLRMREDGLDAERWLLYSAVSRPTERLVLSWHRGDDDGRPAVRSLFVDDVLACLTPGVEDAAIDRRLGELGFAGHGGGPRQRRMEAAMALARPPGDDGLGPLTDPGVLAELRAREGWAARAIELWQTCPVRWLVESLLDPRGLEPDPGPLIRGGVYHRVLQHTFERLGGRLTEAQLQNARSIALSALREECSRERLAGRDCEHTAQARRLEADVLRYLAFAASSGTAFVPGRFELSFGTGRDEHAPVELAPGVRVSGRIDRVDLSPAGDAAIVIDYKGASGATARKRWARDGSLQAGLYALALPELLPGVRAVGALYQPIGAGDQRPRGYLLDGEDPERGDIVHHDRVDDEQAAELLEHVRGCAVRAVEELRAGAVAPRPGPCGYRDEICAHPSICRCSP